MTKTDNTAEIGLHVFEKAGLGKAPFRCVRVESKTYQACPGAPVQVGGSCQYCGTGIVIHCYIKGVDGKEFHVGSDCVAKTGDAGLIRSYKTHPAVRQAARDAAKRKLERVTNEWNALITDPANRAKLASAPRNAESFEWIWARCGAAGKARWLKNLKAAIAAAPVQVAA